MRIGICDTDVQYIQWLTGLLRQIREVGDSTIISYQDFRWLLDDINAYREHFDLLLVSKEQANCSGIDIALQGISVMPSCALIILSNQNYISEDMYQLPHGVFLPKEHVPMHLITVVKRLVASLQQKKETYIYIISNREHFSVPCSDILYMERVLRKTVIVTKTHSIETYQSPKELLEKSGTSVFVQCHRSFFVNMRNIFSISSSHIRLSDSIVIPVGNTFSDSLQKEYSSFCDQRIQR